MLREFNLREVGMKRFLVLLLVLGCLFAGGFYVVNGRFPWAEVPPEEQEVAALREGFQQVRQQWKQAGRAATSGIDTSSVTEAPLARLEQLEKNLEQVALRLKMPQARKQAEDLRRDMAVFKAEMR
jgi:hypothetical protein